MGNTFKTGNYVNAIFQDASNNVGIGAAANASFKLQVTGTTNLTGALSGTSATFSSSVTANNYFRASQSAVGGFFQGWDGTNEVDFGSWKSIIGSGNSYDAIILSSHASSGFFVMTGGSSTPKLTITSAGNVGIGVTPAAWASPTAGKVIQIGNTASIFSYNNLTTDLASNIYFNGSDYLYIQTAAASLYRQQSGEHAWFTVGSGTAGTSAGITERMRITSGGAINLLDSYFLANSSFGYRFNNQANSFNNFIISDNGNASLRGTLTQNASDERLKNNIQTIPNAIDKIKKLRGVTFEWNQEIYETSRTNDIGVIAQDVQSVLSDAVTLAPFDTNFENMTSKSGENYLTVYYEKLIPLLIEGIKEQQVQIEELKALIAAK